MIRYFLVLFRAVSVFFLVVMLSCGAFQRQETGGMREDLDDSKSTAAAGRDAGKPAEADRSSKNKAETDGRVSDEESAAPGMKDDPSGAMPDKSRDAVKKNGKSKVAPDASDRSVTDGEKSEYRIPPPAGKDRPAPSGPSGLKAGFADDNRQYNYFIDFLEKFRSRAKHFPIDVSERIVLRVTDKNTKPVINAKVDVYGGKKLLASGRTYSDGSFLFFPSEYSMGVNSFEAVVEFNQLKRKTDFFRSGSRDVSIRLDSARYAPSRIPIDILFILDTTGSMGEEIERLRRMIELIYLNLSSLPTNPRVRFGLVLYRDRRDEYVTRVVPLTGNLDEFQNELEEVQAGGGGDLPEDLQSALQDSMKKIHWNDNGIRLSFIITDAPPHLDYGQEYTYREAVKEAREKGIKVFSVGTGGLDINGEYVLRQISQYTAGKYIFLTYGEKGEAKGGREGSVSHHTGANYQTDKLESIIIRFAREELSSVMDGRLPDFDDHFTAKKVEYEKNEETLQKLFSMAASQLADYSSLSIGKGTPTSVLPIEPGVPALKVNSEYFSEQLILSLMKTDRFKIVERKNLQAVLRELELTMSGLGERENAAKVGKFLGARLLISGKLYEKQDKFELFLRLLNVETAEVLSVTRARLDPNLGLGGTVKVKKTVIKDSGKSRRKK